MAELIIVKIAQTIASFYSGLSNIVEDVWQQKEAGIKLAGCTLVNISCSFNEHQCSEFHWEDMEEYVKELVET